MPRSKWSTVITCLHLSNHDPLAAFGYKSACEMDMGKDVGACKDVNDEGKKAK
jgi:hypothetical protein